MSFPTKRILCVQDEDNGALLEFLLSDKYQITIATTLAEGQRLAKEGRYDLVLLEGCLPDGTSFELCRQIRNSNSWIPILFYSSLAYEADRQQGLRAGAQVYLVMPNDFERLLPTIARLLNKSVERKASRAAASIG